MDETVMKKHGARDRYKNKNRPHKDRHHKEHKPREKAAPLSRVCGLPAVAAVFARSPERVERLFFEPQFKKDAESFCTHMAKVRKPFRMVDADELAKVAGTPMHGGVVAIVLATEIPMLDVEQARGWAKDGRPLLLLDGVSNPHNLGAIARTAAFFGIPRMILSDHPAQAGLSDASYRVAEGGLDYLNLYRAADFAATVKKLGQFYEVLAAAPGNHTALPALKQGGKPLALVLGNEEEGLPLATQRACGRIVAIPGTGNIQSLNVSASAAILIYALTAGKAG